MYRENRAEQLEPRDLSAFFLFLSPSLSLLARLPAWQIVSKADLTLTPLHGKLVNKGGREGRIGFLIGFLGHFAFLLLKCKETVGNQYR